jgi:hypothetical protein
MLEMLKEILIVLNIMLMMLLISVIAEEKLLLGPLNNY